MVPVWLTRSQLPATDMKRSHKVKVTKKDVYLSDDNLADDQENNKLKIRVKFLRNLKQIGIKLNLVWLEA